MSEIIYAMPPRFLKTAVLWGALGVSLSGCSSLEKWLHSGTDDTQAVENAKVEAAAGKDRAPAGVRSNPLRVLEYCVIDTYSRVGECYPSLELCQRAARGFGMCSGR